VLESIKTLENKFLMI